MTQLPPLTDEQIAAHEAGHALVAHLMGDEISEAKMYTGEQSASVRPTNWPPSRATLLGGVAAEHLLGFAVNPVRAAKDMTHAAALPVDPNEPGARTLLAEHQPALDALRAWFTTARQHRVIVPGDEIHAFLTELGCGYGSRA